MKKMIYVLPMILTSAMYAMQEGQSDQIYIPSNAQITYKITNASSEKVNMELFKIDKSSQRIRAEAPGRRGAPACRSENRRQGHVQGGPRWHSWQGRCHLPR